MDRLRVAAPLEQCWHDVPGGTATSALRTVAALAQGDRTEVTGVSARHRTPPSTAFEPSVPMRQLPLPRTLLYESWHRLRQPSLRRAVPDAQVAYVTGVAVPPADLPLVITVHDLAFLHHPEHHTAQGRRFFNRALTLTRDEATLVVCPSEATRRDCADYGIDDHRLRIVPWGVDQQQADPAAVARLRRDHDLDGPFVLFVGTVEPRKNLRTLAAAMERLDGADATLVLVGPAGWNEDLAAVFADAAYPTKLLGFVSDDDLRALYAAAGVFCYPSLLEGFGLPVLEAMAQATPVVTSAGTATEEVLGDGGLAVDPLDPDQLAAALSQYLGDPADAERAGRRGRDRASTYTWGRTADAVADLLAEAVA